MKNWKVVELTSENFGKYPLGCIKSPKHVGYKGKTPWFHEMREKGLIMLILLDKEEKPQGFLEMMPGPHTWRAVEAESFMVIHCLWVISKKLQGQGAGSFMLKEAEQRVKEDYAGIAVVTSDTSFIASSEIFEKEGYVKSDQKGVYDLYYKLVDPKSADSLEKPTFNQIQPQGYKGLNMLYALQCPMEIKWKEDIEAYCKENKIDIHMKCIDSSQEAQKNPNPLGTFALIYNDEIIEDHPVSLGRFKNIVKKDLQLSPK